MESDTPDKAKPDASRDYPTRRYDEGSLDMAHTIRARIREELDDERAYDDMVDSSTQALNYLFSKPVV